MSEYITTYTGKHFKPTEHIKLYVVDYMEGQDFTNLVEHMVLETNYKTQCV